MRLTLRTLLAYLDDILEPADARELGQKIEESEFASGLVHRIRSVTRKLRLGAPKLAGKGMGLDANTVAEYLDNTLPQDRVPDFEKVCLESDVHLAEVASCHQILTLVLGEPADVDPALRDQIRAMQARVEGMVNEEFDDTRASRPVDAPTPPPMEGRQEEWDEKPDMPLVTPVAPHQVAGGSSIRLLPVVGTLVVAFLLALVALIAMGPLDSDHPILGRFLADASSKRSAPAPTADRDVTQGDLTDSRHDQVPADATAATPGPEAFAAGDTTNQGQVSAGVEATGEPDAGKKAESGDSGEAGIAAGTFPLPPDAAVPPPPAMEDAAEGTVAAPSTEAAAAAPPLPSTLPPGTVEPGTGPAKAMPDGDGTEPAEDSGEPAKEPEPLAHSTSDLHVLARFDPATEMWLRLAPNDPLASGQQLIALPTFRPQIALSNGVQLTLVGPASVSLLDADAAGVPGVVVQFGRILAIGDGKPGTALNLHIGDRISRVVFQDLDSTLALEVQRYLPPGADPEEVTAHWLIAAIAVVGRLAWEEEGDAGTNMLEAGQVATMLDTRGLQVSTASPPPDWLDVKNLRPIDRDASKQLQLLLPLDRPLATSLSEQVSNRLVEVRALAIRSLSLLGIFDPYVNAFNTKELRTFWPDLFDALQQSVVLGGATAANVRSTFERLRGEMGSQLYRQLWGYSAEQLMAGEGEALVGLLSNSSMDTRVLAFENLSRIAGKTNSYHPDIDPQRQKRAILNWERDAKQDGITYKNPPIELPE